MALVKNLNCQLNKDIFETTINIINYIENFLVNYSFKIGKFEQTTTICDIKKIINQKLENNKYIFINKNIHIDIIQDDENYLSDNIEIFLLTSDFIFRKTSKSLAFFTMSSGVIDNFAIAKSNRSISS